MAEQRIYQASLASIIAITGQNQAVPLGLVSNLTLEKRFMIEGVSEIGSYRFAQFIVHGYEATFSWQQAYSAGADLVGLGLVPSDAEIPNFAPIGLRIIDQRGQRNIAFVVDGIAETYSVTVNARALLQKNVSGRAISVQWESEVN